MKTKKNFIRDILNILKLDRMNYFLDGCSQKAIDQNILLSKLYEEKIEVLYYTGIIPKAASC